MKKIGILSFALLLFLGFSSCEKKGEGENTNNTTENTDGNNGTTNNGMTDMNNGMTDAEPVSNMPLTTVEFTEDAHDFGSVKAGEKVNHQFKFRNTGSNPLKISNVKPSCGCTTPDWSKDEIAPGAEGFITVEFDSNGKNGVQKKSVTVTFENTDPKNKMLTFTADVAE